MANREIFKYIEAKITDPLRTIRIIRELIVGLFYLTYYCCIKRNVKIKFPFYVGYKFRITGPGTVKIGKNCAVFPNLLEGLSIVTYSPEASVIVGDNCLFGGTTIRCKNRVEVGEKTFTANCLIQDSIVWHRNNSLEQDRYSIYLKPKKIEIGRNIWIGAMSCVLPGTKIGNDTVLSAGSLVYEINIPDYSLGAGSPVRRPVKIDRIIGLTEK